MIHINDDSHGMYNTSSQIRFKTSMLRSSLCDYSGAYKLVSGTITITGAGADDVAEKLDERKRKRTYDNIRKIATGQGDDYTTGCLLDYNYFNKHFKMIATDLS